MRSKDIEQARALVRAMRAVADSGASLGNQNKVFRSLIDHLWDKNGRSPQTASHKKLGMFVNSLEDAPYSPAAAELTLQLRDTKQGTANQFVHEHTWTSDDFIRTVIRPQIIDGGLSVPAAAKLLARMLGSQRTCVINVAEDKALQLAKFQKRIPDGWAVGADPRRRYQHVSDLFARYVTMIDAGSEPDEDTDADLKSLHDEVEKVRASNSEGAKERLDEALELSRRGMLLTGRFLSRDELAEELTGSSGVTDPGPGTSSS